MKKVTTLTLVERGDEILLGMKKRGFGMGRWNGFGGKVGSGESIEEAAKREVLEEAGIVVESLSDRGIVNFVFEDGLELEMHIFGATSFSGEIKETEEMRPQWFVKESIPFDEMWPDDRYWIPEFLKGKNISGAVYFKDVNTITRSELQFHAPV